MYEAGRLDAAALGGENHYGKLHAKFFLQNEIGFIGTSNFDYRSRLFNNEMGFFFRSGPLAEDLNADFEILKANAYLWGSPEWLELRSKVMDAGGMKGVAAGSQRATYRFLRATGLDWYF